MKKVNLSDAINRVCEEIKNDKGYRISWEAGRNGCHCKIT